jgi:N-acetylmuramoyl-L-alanine amidase
MTTNNGKCIKYAYGSTSDLKLLRRSWKLFNQEFFTSAYIIAFKDGKNITIQTLK